MSQGQKLSKQRDPVQQIADLECNSEPTVQQHTYVGIHGVTVRNGSDHTYDKWSHSSVMFHSRETNVMHLQINAHKYHS